MREAMAILVLVVGCTGHVDAGGADAPGVPDLDGDRPAPDGGGGQGDAPRLDGPRLDAPHPDAPRPDASPGACSGHGTEIVWPTGTVCACDPGFTGGDPDGTTCVPTTAVCAGGAVDYDWNDDGVNETSFEPTDAECLMFELVNLTRATHDAEGTEECHGPLGFSVEWSAHGRRHSKEMADQGSLFHADYPWAQNCAYGAGVAGQMDMYMTGPGEDHCPPLSHHCNIMRCGTSQIGIGYWPLGGDYWNTQNFL